MTLLDQYNDSENSEFHAKIIVAMAKKAGTELNAALPADPDYAKLVMLSRGSLGVNANQMRFVARILSANNINNNSLDADIQTVVDNNFDNLMKVFDPDVG